MIEVRMRLPIDLIKIYICEITLALEALHNASIIFRDLKPSNIMIDGEGHALLTDFGLSKEGIKLKMKTKSMCGSLAYLAPEMINKKGHGFAMDWYLLGVCIYEMVEGSPPFYSTDNSKLVLNILTKPVVINRDISIELKDLIVKLLIKEPE